MSDAADAHRWLELARRGSYPDAWAVSDRIRSRTRMFGNPATPRHEQVIWDGAPVDGRRVLVRCYHGLGDTIQFARFLPPLAERAATVVVWTQPALLSLLPTLPGHYRWLPLHDGAPGVEADVDLEIMELAQLFRPTLATLPRAPYLRADRLHLPDTTRLRVGVAWRSGNWDRTRSLPFGRLAACFSDQRIEWYSLQYPQEVGECHPRLHDLRTASMGTLARLVASLDLVVTVDSMPAHLAGALGAPTFTLLRQHADWRWLEGRDDSPWYPTMRLFRQTDDGDWSAPMARLRDAIDESITRHIDAAQPRAR